MYCEGASVGSGIIPGTLNLTLDENPLRKHLCMCITLNMYLNTPTLHRYFQFDVIQSNLTTEKSNSRH